MKTRNTLIWLLVLLVLGGFVYYQEIIGHKQRQLTQEAEQKIFNVVPEKITSINLLSSGNKIQCVKNKGGHWALSKPIKTVADDSAILNVVLAVLNSKIERVIEEETTKFDTYGLENPALIVTLNTSENHYTLSIGKTTPTKDFVYARKDTENNVFLLQADILPKLNKNTHALRNKQIIKAQAPKVSQVTIKYPSTEIILIQDKKTGWQVTKPVKGRANYKTIGELIYVLDGVHVQKFVAESAFDLAEYGLDKPQAEIDLQMNDGSHQVLLLGKNNGPQASIYAKRKSLNPIFTLPKQTGDYLFKDLNDFRDKTLLFFLPDEISKLHLFNKTKDILLHNNSGAWVVVKPDTAVAVPEFMQSMLKNIAKINTQKFIDQPTQNQDYGFSTPALKVELYLKDGTQQTLTVGHKKAGTTFAYASLGEQIVLINSHEADQIGLLINSMIRSK